jgi:tetratricopeptide (TPR) repeat protein
MKYFIFLLSLPSLLQAASIDVALSSQFLARGEQAVLEITLTDVNPPEELQLPAIPGVTLQARGFGGPNTTILPGRKLGYVYQFALTSFEVGKHQIPELKFQVGTEKITSDALDFEVFDATQIPFTEIVINGSTMRYAAMFRTTKTNPYEGEIIPVELKIYFPANQRIEEWGIPDFDRDGITAWRFEPRPQLGSAILLGAQYQAVSYPSTMAASKSGKVSIGGAKIRLISVQSSIGQFGIEQNLVALNLTAAKLEMDAKPLPANAPAGFRNAVGDFTLTLGINASDTEIREGDPVNVDLAVSGRGNLDSLEAPFLTDPDGWKLYDASRSEQGEERRTQKGTVVFKQFMRPTTRQTMIPPFRLDYFDPIAEVYKSLTTAAVPLKVLPSTTTGGSMMPGPPQAANLPVERMTDILGIINTGPLIDPSKTMDLPHLWHLVPLVLLLTLIAAIMYRRYAYRFAANPQLTARKEAWKSLEKAPTDAVSFYRSVGRFIESWLPEKTQQAEIQDILKQRDAICFHPQPDASPLAPAQRSMILKTIRKLAFTLTIFSAIFTSTLHGEETRSEATKDGYQLYTEGQYKDAITAWLEAGPYEQLTSQTLYNIGNASYRMGSPGYAALYYRRALIADSDFLEARQNLRFLERKFGALTIKRPEYQYTLTKIPLAWLQNTLFISLWLIVLGILVFPATNRGSKLRIYAIVACIVCPFLLLAAAAALHYYPDDATFAPYSEQAIIVSEKAVAYADASRTSAEVIDAPAGSLCRIIQRSDRWVYIAFATQTRGWVPADAIEEIIPNKPQKAPQLKTSTEPKAPSA